jgi:hypothetical protein
MAISVAAASAVSQVAEAADDYWTGAISNSWTLALNWAANSDGTGAQAIPGTTTTVDLYATNANPNNLSISFPSSQEILGINMIGTQGVTVGAGGGNGALVMLDAGGISVASGAGQLTFGTRVFINKGQTWYNSSGNAIQTPAGLLVDGNTNAPLTIGSGTLELRSNISLPGGFIINPGATLKINGGGSDRSTSQIVTVNGTEDLNGQTAGFGYIAGSGTITNSSGTLSVVQLDMGGNKGTVFSGTITGKAYLDLRSGGTGAGTLTLTGANTFTTALAIIGDFGAAGQSNCTLALAGGDNRLPSTTAVYLGGSVAPVKVRLVLGDDNGASNQTISSLSCKSVVGTAGSVVGGNATAISTLTITGASDGSYGWNGVLGGTTTAENNLGITKTGAFTFTTVQKNTYAGNTSVTAGTFAVSSAGGLRFVIGSSGTNNQMQGAGTVDLGGSFTFDLTSASQNVGDSWQIVASSLNHIYEGTFSVTGFTQNGSLFTQTIDSSKYYQFSESSGALSVVAAPEPGSLSVLMLGGFMLIRRRKSQD